MLLDPACLADGEWCCCWWCLWWAVSLRLQVASEKVVEKAFGEYAFCNLVLFLVVFNFLG